LIIVGVAYSEAEVERNKVANTEKDSWSVSANFTVGEKIIVNLVPHQDWTRFTEPTDEYPYGVLHVMVDVIDPYGNKTSFWFPWAKPQPGFVYLLPDPPGIEVLSLGSLINPGFTQIGALGGAGGITRYNGTYIANVSSTFPPVSSSPPRVIQLVVGKKETIQPYSSFLYVGVGTCVFGAAVTAYGIKAKKEKRRLKLKRKD
jgi:hypothetical protein